MSTGVVSLPEILAYLKRIDAKLDAVLAKRQQEERSRPAMAASEPVAGDQDLDGKFGNPKVRFTPRGWDGDNFKGATFADCPPEFLDMMANALEHFASKNAAADPKKASYERLDAARARGWAIRKRNGWDSSERASAPATGGDYDFDDGEADAHQSQFDDDF